MSGIRETERKKRQVYQNISDAIIAISEKRAKDKYREAEENARRDERIELHEEEAALLTKKFNRIANVDFSDKKSVLNAIDEIYRTYIKESSINSRKSGYSKALKFGKKKWYELIVALKEADCDKSEIKTIKKQYNGVFHPNRTKYIIKGVTKGVLYSLPILLIISLYTPLGIIVLGHFTDPDPVSKKIEKAITKGDLDKGLDLLLSFGDGDALSSCDGPKRLINEFIKKGDVESAERIRAKCPRGYGEYLMDYYIEQGDFEAARKCIVFEDYDSDYKNHIDYYDAALCEHYVVQYTKKQIKEGVPKNKISSQLNADLKEVLAARDYYYLDKGKKELFTRKQLNSKLLNTVYEL